MEVRYVGIADILMIDKSLERLSVVSTMRSRTRTVLAWLAPLRAVLALAFLILTSLQPVMFATASIKGLQGSMELAGGVIAQPTAHGKHAHRQHSSADVVEDESSRHHHGEQADTACEVHCAPATAVPVELPDMQGPVGRDVEPVLASVLIDGEYVELIRPPRT